MITLLTLVFLAVLVQVLPIDAKVKQIFNYIIIALALFTLILMLFPWPSELSRWPR